MPVTIDRFEPQLSRGTFGLTSLKSAEGRLYAFSIVCMAAVYFAAHDFVPPCFDDCYGYIPLMGVPFFSPLYWLIVGHMFRSFSIPMIYSLLGEHNEYSTYGVIVFQTVVAFVSWIAFALAVVGRINGRRMRWLFFVTVASGMFSRGYLTFDSYFLSDSLALSFMLVWLGILVSPFLLMDLVRRWFGRSWLVAFLIIIGIVTAMTASARDANILLIVCCTPIAMLSLGSSEVVIPEMTMRRIAILIGIVILSVSAVQWRFSANRRAVNMANVIAGVVLPNAERREYFAARGMPPSLSALKLPAGLQGRRLREITDDRPVVLQQVSLVRNAVYYLAPDFVRGRAGAIYASYLIRHPGYVAGNIIESWPIMFDQLFGDKFRFNGALSMFQFSKLLSVADWIEVRLFVLISVVLLIATLFFVRGGWSDFVLSLGVLLAVAGTANAVIGFHGDLWEVSEMGRHAWIGSTFLRIGTAIIFLRSVQMLTARFRASVPSS